MPDRIEAGTYLIAAALKSEGKFKNYRNKSKDYKNRN